MTLSTLRDIGSSGLHVRYEKAGLILDALPIPWNADAVIVEATVRLPAGAPRQKQEFTLQLSTGAAKSVAEVIGQDSKRGPLRVFFRLPVPPQSCSAQVFWREHELGRVEIPKMTAAEYVQGFTLEMPTLHVAIGQRTVACQSFVKAQAKQVFASALVRGIGPLAAALDLDLCVQVERQSGRAVDTVLVSLTSEQRRARQALVTVLLPKLRWIDGYRVSWHLASRCLHTQTIRAISQKTFVRSLRVSATRFIVSKNDTMQSLRALPLSEGRLMLEGVAQVVPCLYVCSSVAGMAGVAQFTLRALADDVVTTIAIKDDLLATDGPAPIILGSVTAVEAARIKHFSLWCGDTNLGNLPLLPAPKADFNAEGGFVPLDDFLWSPAAEEQLNERLGKLLDDG